jgi:hypothetical protein
MSSDRLVVIVIEVWQIRVLIEQLSTESVVTVIVIQVPQERALLT